MAERRASSAGLAVGEVHQAKGDAIVAGLDVAVGNLHWCRLRRPLDWGVGTRSIRPANRVLWASALRQREQLPQRLALRWRPGQSVNGGDFDPAQRPVCWTVRVRLFDFARRPFAPDAPESRVTAQFSKSPFFNFADAAFRNSHNRGDLLLTEKTQLAFRAAAPDPDRRLARRSRLRGPPAPCSGFPLLGKGQCRFPVPQAGSSPNLPSSLVAESGDPPGAAMRPMQADLD